MRVARVTSDFIRQLRAEERGTWLSLRSLISAQVLSRIPVPSHVDREELLSDTVTAVWQSLATLRDDRKLLAFATTIARRLILKRARESKRFLSLSVEPKAPIDDRAARNLEAEELYKIMLNSLKSADEILFQLLYVVGANHRQIQAEMEVSSQALRKRKCLLLKKLRAAVRSYETDQRSRPTFRRKTASHLREPRRGACPRRASAINRWRLDRNSRSRSPSAITCRCAAPRP